MSYYIEISIFGDVAAPLSALKVGESIRDEENLDGEVDEFDFVEALIKAAAKGEHVEYSGHGYNDVFQDVRNACQEAGLSYVWMIGDSRAESLSNGLAWKPGMGQEIEFLIHDRQIGVPLKALSAATKLGPDATVALIEQYRNVTRIGRVTLAEGFEEAYVAVVEGMEENEEATASLAR